MNLEDLLPLVQLVAQDRTGSHPSDFDDAVQEGLIAAWTAMERHPGQSDAYYRTAARKGILNVAMGRSATGSKKRKGVPTVSGADPIFDGEGNLIIQPLIEDNVESAELGGIDAMLSGMPEIDQKIAIGVALGLSLAEVAEVLGSTRDAVRGRWRRKTVPTLQNRLRHYSTM